MHWTVIVVGHSLKEMEKIGNVASGGGRQKIYIKDKGEEQKEKQYTEMIQSNRTYQPTQKPSNKTASNKKNYNYLAKFVNL